MVKLDIAIATHKRDGILRLAANSLPPISGVRYIISWQDYSMDDIPESLQRDDIKIYRFDKLGQSLNRNNAIDHCESEIVLLSDDDVVFCEKGIKKLLETYDKNPDIDFIACRSIQDNGASYPEKMCVLSNPLPKGYFASCIELSFRRSTGLKCCPELGLASPRMHGGEDEILLQTAIHRGMKCIFLPEDICIHEHPSTGSKMKFTASNLRAHGCVTALTYKYSAFARCILKAWRISRKGQATLPVAIIHILQGMVEAKGLKRRNRQFLW